jgi:hypothetical protein
MDTLTEDLSRTTLAPGCKYLTVHDVEVIQYRQGVQRSTNCLQRRKNSWFGAIVGIVGGLIVLSLFLR